jgi:hypothetical protein
MSSKPETPDKEFTRNVMACINDISNFIPILANHYKELEILAAFAEHTGGALRIFMRDGTCTPQSARSVVTHIDATAFTNPVEHAANDHDARAPS